MILKTVILTKKQFGLKGIKLLLMYYGYKLSSKFIGPGVSCPICGWKGKQFLPFLLQQCWVRPAAACPQCGALERHRALFIFYSSVFSGNVDGKKLLHFAPEECFINFFSKLPIEYIQSHYKCPGEGDMQDIRYPDSFFDWVLSHHVLEHVENDKKALGEVWRVLKNNGICYLSVPISWKIRTIDYGFPNPDEHEHYRSYGYDITERFRGFVWKRIDFKDFIDERSFKEFGINTDEPLFELRKGPVDEQLPQEL